MEASNDKSAGSIPPANKTESHVKVGLKDTAVKLSGRFEESVPDSYPHLTSEEVLNQIRAGHAVERCFVKKLTLSGAFDRQVSFKEVYIEHLHINQASFANHLSFQGCRIRRSHVSESTFSGSLAWKYSHLHFFHFDQNVCESGFNASSLHTLSKYILSNSTFHGRVRFWEAHLGDWVTFESCMFHDRVDLRSTHFEAGFTAPQCTFQQSFLFRGAHLAMKWEATGSRFNNLVDFSKAKLNDFVYLEDIEAGPDLRWAFWNTVSERITIHPRQVEGRLLSEEEGRYEEAMREYGVLKRSFEAGNLYTRDDWAFYRFKVNERRARRASWSKPWSKIFELIDWLFLDWGCGYGTHPGRAIRTALVLIVVFALIFTLGSQYLHPPENLPFPNYAADSLLNRACISLFVSLAAFTSGFGDLRGVAVGWLNIPIMIEALLGTLMWGLFIVAFGRKVIR